MLRLLPLLLFIILTLFNPQARAGVVCDCEVGAHPDRLIERADHDV